MKSRLENPAMLLPEAMQALMAVGAAARQDNGVPATTLNLIYLRASQINGCSVCVDMHARTLRQAGETDERIISIGAWRDAPYFTEPERAALALTEYTTRLSDRSDPVPDDIWFEAAQHYDEKALAALTLNIALINFWNRMNVPTRQVAGEWLKSAAAQKWMKENAAAAH
ncbi:MAG TPA: carboxymuconolactone decarboxylase family protein [Edaphobacter sp.]|jgi:AhpD family alkylhydroperoxidase|nr:carboxymuconolactone decarboxylase family protein [Edaphobacter sp.]